ARVWYRSTRRIRGNVGAMVGIALLLVVLGMAVLADIIAPYPSTAQDLGHALQPPSLAHWFGTDTVGRDIFSRVVAGSRISLQIVILVLGVALTIGGTLGSLAGYYGGLVDEIVMRVADVFFAFPHFLLAMAVVAALGPGLQNAMIAIAVAYWPRYARLIRASILKARAEPYIEAARSVGCLDRRIIVRHLMPNSVAPVLVQATMDAGIAILTTASLSFVGLGAVPPTPEWGAMVAGGRNYILTAWWIPTFPGILISIAVAGFMFLGDGLRDLLDPTLRGRVGF
ncbi:MAG TPA: ABC transporter permease, partial [Candidatus Limnocylindria bacterium]|nr:ABC transporter permease [Candidatus Limnocylindria bacterium]